MFEFWNDQFAKSMEMWTRMNPAATQQQELVPLYSQLFNFGDAFRSFYEELQKQGLESLSSEELEKFIQSCSLNAGFPNPGATLFQQNVPWFSAMNLPFAMGGFDATQPAQLPALGLGREWQEDFSKYHEMQAELAKAAREYAKQYEHYMQRVGERFKDALQEEDLGELSFEKLGSIWIDCCESEFQEIASTKEYSVAYGGLINASMRLRKHANEMQEKTARLMNIPSREELNTLHQSNMALKQQLNDMQAHITALEAEISNLKKAARTKPPARRKTAPRKPRTTKPKDK